MWKEVKKAHHPRRKSKSFSHEFLNNFIAIHNDDTTSYSGKINLVRHYTLNVDGLLINEDENNQLVGNHVPKAQDSNKLVELHGNINFIVSRVSSTVFPVSTAIARQFLKEESVIIKGSIPNEYRFKVSAFQCFWYTCNNQ